jgi:hypothetical protein
VVAWANDSLTVAGLIKAAGGAQGGDGGFVETSGGSVNFSSIRVDTSAPAGKTGTWLVDPTSHCRVVHVGGSLDSGRRRPRPQRRAAVSLNREDRRRARQEAQNTAPQYRVLRSRLVWGLVLVNAQRRP